MPWVHVATVMCFAVDADGSEPALMAEIFSNYDCDVNQANLFEDLVRFLAAVCSSSTVLQHADAIHHTTHGPVPQTSIATLEPFEDLVRHLSTARGCRLSVVCCMPSVV